MPNRLFVPYIPLLKTTLVVEDNSIIRLDIEETLRSFGIELVSGASTLEAALQMAEVENIGFAILDFEIGRKTSLPVAQRLVQMGIPVLFLTAYGNDVELPPELSHLTILAKPFTTSLLAEGILRSLNVTGGLRTGVSSDA